MSLDAMDWVWNRSAAKGNARMVLLAIADKCPGPECTAYAGTTMLMQYVNASRSSVRESVDKLIDAGELKEVENRKGPRGETVYCLPHAVGHSRPAPGESVRHRAGICPGANPDPGQEPTRRGSGSAPAEGRISAPRGTDFCPQNAKNQEEHKKQQQMRAIPAAPDLPEELRSLTEALGVAGVTARWNLGVGEQQQLQGLVRRHGQEVLVDLAAQRVRPGEPPKPARYWLKVWGDLDHMPTHAAIPGANVLPLRRTTNHNHTDRLTAGLALLEEQEGLAQ